MKLSTDTAAAKLDTLKAEYQKDTQKRADALADAQKEVERLTAALEADATTANASDYSTHFVQREYYKQRITQLQPEANKRQISAADYNQLTHDLQTGYAAEQKARYTKLKKAEAETYAILQEILSEAECFRSLVAECNAAILVTRFDTTDQNAARAAGYKLLFDDCFAVYDSAVVDLDNKEISEDIDTAISKYSA